MKHLAHIAQQVFNTVLAIDQRKMEAILAAIGPRLGIEIPVAAQGDPYEPAQRKSYAVDENGICQIPVQGALMKKAYGLWALSGCGSYERIQAQIADAIDDPAVKGICLDIDSPGGTTNGCFELSDFIYSCRGQKPIYAAANDQAASAAYAIASAADKVFVTRTGGVGSVGVFALHVDQSDQDEMVGLKYTYVYAGDKKIDGNPHEPLSRTAKSDLQKEVDREYGMFVKTVARNRKADEKEIRGTEAAVYFADGSVPLLADKVGSYDEAVAALTKKVSGSTSIFISGETHRQAGEQLPEVKLQAAIAAESEGRMAQIEEQDPLAIVAGKKSESADDEYVKDKGGKKAEDSEAEEKCEEADESKKGKKSKKAKAAMPKEDDEDENEEEEDEKEKGGGSGKKAAVATRVAELCAIAGFDNLTGTFILKGYTEAQVIAKLAEKRAAASAKHDVSAHFGVVSTGTIDDIDQQARALSRNTGVSVAMAYKQLLTQNPQMYQDYLDERENAMLTSKSKREYMARMQQKLQAQGKGTQFSGITDKLPEGSR